MKSPAYRADSVESRDTLAIRTFMCAYKKGLEGIPNTSWALNFVFDEDSYNVMAGFVDNGQFTGFMPTERTAHVPEDKDIGDIVNDESRFIRERHGRIHFFVNSRPYKQSSGEL